MKYIFLKIYFFLFFIITFNACFSSYDNQLTDAVIEQANVKFIQNLIDHGADVNQRFQGICLLEIACNFGNKPMAQCLVSNGALVVNYFMNTPEEQLVLRNKLKDSCNLSVNGIGTIQYMPNTNMPNITCKEVFFLRHGNTFATDQKIFTDKDNALAHLNDQGIQEIKDISQAIIQLKPDVILTSSLGRCQQTLNLIYAELPEHIQQSIILETVPWLHSIHHGSWEGKNKNELQGKDLMTWFAKWNNYVFAQSPHGESLADLIIRISSLISLINQKYSNKTILIIGHGSVSWALAVLLRTFDQPADNNYQIHYGELKKLY